jgi:hypothetical protein
MTVLTGSLAWTIKTIRDFTVGDRETESFNSSPDDHITKHALAHQLYKDRGRTEVSCPSRPAPPNVNSVPGATLSVLVKVNAGVATWSLTGDRVGKWRWWNGLRVSPRAATGSHPPDKKGAATLKTC